MPMKHQYQLDSVVRPFADTASGILKLLAGEHFQKTLVAGGETLENKFRRAMMTYIVGTQRHQKELIKQRVFFNQLRLQLLDALRAVVGNGFVKIPAELQYLMEYDEEQVLKARRVREMLNKEDEKSEEDLLESKSELTDPLLQQAFHAAHARLGQLAGRLMLKFFNDRADDMDDRPEAKKAARAMIRRFSTITFDQINAPDFAQTYEEGLLSDMQAVSRAEAAREAGGTNYVERYRELQPEAPQPQQGILGTVFNRTWSGLQVVMAGPAPVQRRRLDDESHPAVRDLIRMIAVVDAFMQAGGSPRGARVQLGQVLSQLDQQEQQQQQNPSNEQQSPSSARRSPFNLSKTPFNMW